MQRAVSSENKILTYLQLSCDLNTSEHYLLSDYRHSDFKMFLNVLFIWIVLLSYVNILKVENFEGEERIIKQF